MNFFLKLLAFVLMTAPLSANTLAAYWIDAMDHPPDNYKLTKANGADSDGPVTLYKNLEKGDCIIVTGTGAKLSIASDSGIKQTIGEGNPPKLCIDKNDTRNPPQLYSNLMEWAGRWLSNRISSPTTARSVVSAVSRGDEAKGIAFLLADEEGMKMVTGKRPVYLAWQGGKPPFTVRMVWEGGQKIIFERRNITANRVKTDPLPLAEGAYRIEIGDAVETISRNLHIVSLAEMPSPALESHGSKGSQDREELVEAVRLASKGEGWAFEAYQTAARLAPPYQPAQILQESLEQGDIPKSMPE